jgi:hypothetical protein
MIKEYLYCPPLLFLQLNSKCQVSLDSCTFDVGISKYTMSALFMKDEMVLRQRDKWECYSINNISPAKKLTVEPEAIILQRENIANTSMDRLKVELSLLIK